MRLDSAMTWFSSAMSWPTLMAPTILPLALPGVAFISTV